MNLHIVSEPAKQALSISDLGDGKNIREALQQSFKNAEGMREISIVSFSSFQDGRSVRMGMSEQHERLFRDFQSVWRSKYLQGATIADKQWYPVKLDRVPKYSAVDRVNITLRMSSQIYSQQRTTCVPQ